MHRPPRRPCERSLRRQPPRAAVRAAEDGGVRVPGERAPISADKADGPVVPMRTGTMIRRTLAITAAAGLVLALGAAAVSAVPVDRSREPARATVQHAYRVAKPPARPSMNRANGLPAKRSRFAWRIGRARPRLGFVCIKRGTH